MVDSLLGALTDYRTTPVRRPPAPAWTSYEFVDLARKVVGVGSVGTRCWVALFVGRDNGDPLVLQIKQAEDAVGEPFLGPSELRQPGPAGGRGPAPDAERQRHLPRLGHGDGADGVVRDFYFRQLWDWKLSADIETMPPEALAVYAQMCGWTLARAHARSGDAIAIGSYLGAGTRFDESMCRFAASYADQNEKDFEALTPAIATDRIHAISRRLSRGPGRTAVDQPSSRRPASSDQTDQHPDQSRKVDRTMPLHKHESSVTNCSTRSTPARIS